MRGDLVNLSIKAFNKHFSGLTLKCLEIPHYAYSSRYSQWQDRPKQNDQTFESEVIRKFRRVRN